jgi:hypothetical protein
MGLCARAQSLELHDRTDRSAGALAPCAHAEPAPSLAQTHHESSPWLAAHHLQRIPDWRVRWRCPFLGASATWVHKNVLRRTSDRWAAVGARLAVDLPIRRYVKFLTQKEIFGRVFRSTFKSELSGLS